MSGEGEALLGPRALGEPPVTATLRAEPADFRVDEVLGFEPDGSGQHAWLQIEKTGTNTEWLGKQLARAAGLPPRAVSWSGRKDRHAVTTQWYSLDLAGRPEPDWAAALPEGVRLLVATRHGRKLRRGTHAANRFELRLREVAGDTDALVARAAEVARRGVPNYFGPQRFGRDGDNVAAARAWLAGGERRGPRDILLSAARSWLFNRILAARVAAGEWEATRPEEPVLLAGSGSFFVPEAGDADVRDRLARGDLHPSGPLWGRGGAPITEAERALVADAEDLTAGLEQAGLKAERRALRLMVPDLEAAEEEAGTWRLAFSLPRGAFATTVVRELAETDASL